MYNTYYSQSRALVIGIDQYIDRRLSPLGNAETDARQVAETLSDAPYHFDTNILLGSEATRTNILDALYELRAADADERQLVYFAGHGYTIYDLQQHPTGFIAAHDTVADREHTAIELNRITDLTRFSPAKHISFILDSCYSAAALGLFAPRDNVAADRLLMKPTYQALTAGEKAVSDARSMTRYLLEALQAEDVNPGTGLFTLSDLGEYVRSRMLADTKSRQVPQFGYVLGSSGGDIILRMPGEQQLPIDLLQALKSQRPAIRQAAVVELYNTVRDDSIVKPLALKQLSFVQTADSDEVVREQARRYLEAIRSGAELSPRQSAPEASLETSQGDGTPSNPTMSSLHRWYIVHANTLWRIITGLVAAILAAGAIVVPITSGFDNLWARTILIASIGGLACGALTGIVIKSGVGRRAALLHWPLWRWISFILFAGLGALGVAIANTFSFVESLTPNDIPLMLVIGLGSSFWLTALVTAIQNQKAAA